MQRDIRKKIGVLFTAGTAAFAVGAAIGWVSPVAEASPPARHAALTVASDGEERLFVVERVLDSVSRTTAKSAPSVTLHWDVESLLDEESRVNYSWVLSTDRFQELYQGSGKSQKVEKKGIGSTEGWELPQLNNGYYRMELTTVVRGKSGKVGNGVTSWFFRIQDGELIEITDEQWQLESQASVAVEVGT
jgi:hypothetical protein